MKAPPATDPFIWDATIGFLETNEIMLLSYSATERQEIACMMSAILFLQSQHTLVRDCVAGTSVLPKMARSAARVMLKIIDEQVSGNSETAKQSCDYLAVSSRRGG